MHVKDGACFFDGAFAAVAVLVGAAVVHDDGAAGADEPVHFAPGVHPGAYAEGAELPEGAFEVRDKHSQKFFAVEPLPADVLERGDGTAQVRVIEGAAVDVDAYAEVHGGLWGAARGLFDVNEFGEDTAELVLSAEDVVRPLDGDFSDALVAESPGVGFVLQAPEDFGEGEGGHLRQLRGAPERDPVEGNEEVEVEVESCGRYPGAFVAAAARGLRVGDNKGAGNGFSGGRQRFHEAVGAFGFGKEACGGSAKAAQVPVAKISFGRKHFRHQVSGDRFQGTALSSEFLIPNSKFRNLNSEF